MSGIRNVAIIAHVDHGKTTLVDKIIHQCKVVDDRKDSGELILDNNDLSGSAGSPSWPRTSAPRGKT